MKEKKTKRYAPIPPVKVQPTKKQKEKKKKFRVSEHDKEEIMSLLRFKEGLKNGGRL